MKGLIGIKQGKNPTAKQKQYISGTLGLDPKAWLVVSWTNGKAILVGKKSGEVRTVSTGD